ncbi:MAG: hypothetical protein HDR50_06840 [Desulfovibrio sp.]|uniref:hypothetical protein n=1 Tax=Desulfovibrio sp. TaxID=885 RepID=UPI001A6CE73A|nr:hypothetical protein [Desulfovibrio sp.]MBD5417364.1 hypothetical protein [Desulfovibrio sp.]
MAAYLQFIAGDFGKTKYYYTGKDSFSGSGLFGKSLSLSDIASCEVQGAGENVKKAGGAVGGAIIGGVLTGGVGAIVGSVAGGNQVETTVVITTRDGKQGLARANGPMMDAIRGHLFELQRAQAQGGLPPVKKKRPLWQKVAIAILVMAAIGAVLPDTKKQDAQKEPVTTQQQAAPEAAPPAPTSQKAKKDPCEGITPKTWDEASALWKTNHPECRPKGR